MYTYIMTDNNELTNFYANDIINMARNMEVEKATIQSKHIRNTILSKYERLLHHINLNDIEKYVRLDIGIGGLILPSNIMLLKKNGFRVWNLNIWFTGKVSFEGPTTYQYISWGEDMEKRIQLIVKSYDKHVLKHEYSEL
jgi:hypothetical protein